MLNTSDCLEQHEILTPNEATDVIATTLVESRLCDPAEALELAIRAAEFVSTTASYMLALGMQIGLCDPLYAQRVLASWRDREGEDDLLDATPPEVREHLAHRFPLLPDIYTSAEALP